MKVVVTGGAGFIGSHVVDAYLAQGHQVLVIDNLSSGFRRQVPEKAEFVEADIRSEAARQAVAKFAPQVLNHHAAQMDVRKSVDDPRFDADVNLLGFINVLEAVKTVKGARVIFASSGGAAYGEQERFPADEEHPTRPASPYGVSKRAGELYLGCYAGIYGLPYTALRYANVYGPRQNPHGEAGVVAIFSKKLLAGEPCVINGDGKQTRDYVYVEDVVRANMLATEKDYRGEINIGTGVETDVVTLYAHIGATAGPAREAKHAEAKLGEQRRSVLAIDKAKRVLNWSPAVDIKDGIARTVEFFRAAR